MILLPKLTQKTRCPPLIVLKATVAGIAGRGLYDPGSNISTISKKFLLSSDQKLFMPLERQFKTLGGQGLIIGITIVNMKILNIYHRVRMYVVIETMSNHDFILGLDLIPIFGLSLNHKLQLSQFKYPNKSQQPFLSNTTNSQLSHHPSINWNEAISNENFNTKVAHLDKGKRLAIHNLINKYCSIFAKNKFDVGNVKNYEARIELTENKYINKKPYRCSYDDQQEIDRQISELLKHNLIRESSSPFASPVTLQFKKTGEGGEKEKTRMCNDFRDMNKILVPESHPFPLISDLIEKTRDCLWFTAVDINSAFWAIPIRESDRYKTGFVTAKNHYEWSCLPFGLKTSSSVFQRILSGVLRRHKLDNFCSNYIDDILIFSKSFEEHLSHMEALFKALQSEGFRLKFIKCEFATHTIRYLGHIIEHNSIRPINDNLAAINKFPPPKNRKQIRQFLGKVNFYNRFIPNSANILEPFHGLLRKNVPFH